MSADSCLRGCMPLAHRGLVNLLIHRVARLCQGNVRICLSFVEAHTRQPPQAHEAPDSSPSPPPPPADAAAGGAGPHDEEWLLEDAPPDMVCPVSFKLMTDPVVGMDGHTYQRKALQEYIDYRREREWRSSCLCGGLHDSTSVVGMSRQSQATCCAHHHASWVVICASHAQAAKWSCRR